MFNLANSSQGPGTRGHCIPVICINHPQNPHQGVAILPLLQTGKLWVCSLPRTPGAVPRAHTQEAEHHLPGCRPPSPAGPWEKPDVEEALGSGPRTVSRRYLSSLKNKLSNGTWRKSCQPRTCPGPGTQVPEGWGRSGELGSPPLTSPHTLPARASTCPAGITSPRSRLLIKCLVCTSLLVSCTFPSV